MVASRCLPPELVMIAGVCTHVDDIREAVSAITDPGSFARQICRHRVVNLSLANLARAGAGDLIKDALLELDRARMAVHAHAARVSRLTLLTAILDGLVDYLILRGLAMENWYPAGAVRDSHDFDILVPDEAQFWRCYGALCEAGFKPWGLPYVIRYLRPDLTVAETVLVRVDDAEDRSAALVNLLAGRFPITLNTCLDIDLFRNAQPTVVNGIPIPSCSAADTIPLIAAHGLSHLRLDFKDVNDFHALVNRAGVDLEASMRGHGYLAEIMDCLLAGLSEAYSHSVPSPEPPAVRRARLLFADGPHAVLPGVWPLVYRCGRETGLSRAKSAGAAVHLATMEAMKRWAWLRPLVRRRICRQGRVRGRFLLPPACQLFLEPVGPPISSPAHRGWLTPGLSYLRIGRAEAVLSSSATCAGARWAPPRERTVARLRAYVESVPPARASPESESCAEVRGGDDHGTILSDQDQKG